MEYQTSSLLFEKHPVFKSKDPAVRWFKEWVPQEIAATGGKCYLLKWVTEDMLKALKENCIDQEPEEAEPEPTTEILFLCSYEGCGKTFIDAGALRKHSHIHGERQYVCHFEGCGKKFLDSSKLKRHFLIHTGERAHVCPYEGCGKAFSLDFNLRAHMKTHSEENYHICPYEDCGKRYAHEYKLRTHIKMHHEKNPSSEIAKHILPDKIHSGQKTPPAVHSTPTPDRPYACPYEGCGKAYIHEYKLNLHLRREHPGHNAEENARTALTSFTDVDHDMDETAPDRDIYASSRNGGTWKSMKRSRPKSLSKTLLSSKIGRRKGSSLAPSTNLPVAKKSWLSKETFEEDSEETEEDREEAEDGWRFDDNNVDEETEYED